MIVEYVVVQLTLADNTLQLSTVVMFSYTQLHTVTHIHIRDYIHTLIHTYNYIHVNCPCRCSTDLSSFDF